MNSTRLPAKLAKEPLIDVVFEVRFASSIPGGSILPGIVFAGLGDQIARVESLPAQQLPQQVRELDPALLYAPLTRIVWGSFAVLIGDKTLGIACAMPYPGWTEFKKAILKVMNILDAANFVTSIERHSLKYVDFFETGQDHAAALQYFDLALKLGTHEVVSENTNIRVELLSGSFLHAIQIMTSATIQSPNMPERVGAVLEVGTVQQDPELDVSRFIRNLPGFLDEIHNANKEIFFECLSKEGLSKLEPQYE